MPFSRQCKDFAIDKIWWAVLHVANYAMDPRPGKPCGSLFQNLSKRRRTRITAFRIRAANNTR